MIAKMVEPCNLVPTLPIKTEVFDCSARYQGVSLNDVLYQGPELANSLISVLAKFRQEPVAISGDNEKMFYQVQVAENDSNHIRFYWGRMATSRLIQRSAVWLWTYLVLHIRWVLRILHCIKLSNFPWKNFHVDDNLCSVYAIDEVVTNIQKISRICQKGGLRLTEIGWIGYVLQRERPMTPSMSECWFRQFPFSDKAVCRHTSSCITSSEGNSTRTPFDFVIPRCHKPSQIGCLRNAQLDMFSDASEKGYGVAGYIRLSDDVGPRLELVCSSKSPYGEYLGTWIHYQWCAILDRQYGGDPVHHHPKFQVPGICRQSFGSNSQWFTGFRVALHQWRVKPGRPCFTWDCSRTEEDWMERNLS